MTVEAIVDAVQAKVAGLAGMRTAPDDPIEAPNSFPFGTTQPSGGEYLNGSVGAALGDETHDITAFILVARKELPRDIQKSIGYVDLFKTALAADPTLGGAVEGVTGLSYEYGVVNWAGLDLLGYTFTVSVRVSC